ncbi:MAG: hypothetical protein JNK41_13170 [Saprospiraceae bacterium]|nr:hypothetical protein [Saprospiraceae bacterium]
MKILNIQAHRGPNVWSIQHPKLIQLRLEIEEEDMSLEPLNMNSLKKFIPGFSSVNQDKIDIPTVTGTLALTLQQHAGQHVGFLYVKPTIEHNVYNVIFEYQDEETGKEAARFAVNILTKILNHSHVVVADFINELKNLTLKNNLDAFTESVISEAKERDIPVSVDTDEKIIQLGYGKFLKTFTYTERKDKYPPENQNASNFLESLFPKDSPSRIPIIAITGTNGKTTTSRLIAHILQINDQTVGYTTSDGIYVGSEMVDKGDTTGPVSAQKVLSDKRVDVAVLECARGGIVRAGLGFDKCDVSVVTNIQEDHLGLSDIHTIEELAAAKGIIIDVLKQDGYAICNAENKYSRELGFHAKSNHAFFAIDGTNSWIQQHINSAGLACIEEQNIVTIIRDGQKISIAHVKDIPVTFGGRVSFMIQNVLAATLACYSLGLKPGQISKGLATFFPSAEQTPGRLNIFEFNNFKVMVDFAHNPDGFRGIRDFMATIDSPYKIGIITGTGDRRDSDLLELGSLSAQMFDHIIISQRKFLRGRTAEEIVGLLIEGIKSHNPQASYEYIPDSVEPLKHALGKRTDNCFICALSDVLDKPLEMIPKFQGKEKLGKLE